MTTEISNSYEFFEHGALSMVRDTCSRLVSIPTGNDLEGFLAVDRDSGLHAQVQFIKTADESVRGAHKSLWNSFLNVDDSSIVPKVIAITEHDGTPCCVSSIPMGEPVNHFINRNGDLPPEVAVRLVLNFATAIRHHNPSFYQKFAISPESVWISRSQSQPELVLAELSPLDRSDPEANNVSVCLNLLKYLTGNPTDDARFQGLCKQIQSGPSQIEFLERSLTSFAEANPAANYWMGYNDPASLLERIIAAESAARLAAGRPESVIVETARKSFWPGLIAATLAIGAFITYCLITLKVDPVVEAQAPAPLYAKAPAQPASIVVKRKPVKVTPPRPQPVIRQAPRPAARVVTFFEEPTVNLSDFPEPILEAKEDIDPKSSEVLKGLLSNTGELFKEMIETKSEWLIDGDQEKNKSQAQLQVFSPEDEKALKLLELKRAATEAKRQQRPFEAIKHEVALLKLKPDSIDARIRLHDHLSAVQHMKIGRTGITEEEFEILVEASSENAKARDILTKHYNDGANWN